VCPILKKLCGDGVWCCYRGSFPRTRLSGSRLSWPTLARARFGLVPTFHRREKKLVIPFGLSSSPRLLDVAQETRLSLSGIVVTPVDVQPPAYRLGCGNVGMAVGVSRESGGS